MQLGMVGFFLHAYCDINAFWMSLFADIQLHQLWYQDYGEGVPDKGGGQDSGATPTPAEWHWGPGAASWTCRSRPMMA